MQFFGESSFENQGGCLTVVKYYLWDTPLCAILTMMAAASVCPLPARNLGQQLA
ncbi:hypothetical protein J6TS7_16120 [Paenibacillus dendritiformis]|nr:hypothetical protein J6TS7_16120 [Paenibacillus dendritiformis]